MYAEMYENIEVKAYFINGMSLHGGIEAGNLDYLSSSYFENTIRNVESYNELRNIIMTNDIERYTEGALTVEFLEGYDYSSFYGVGTVYGEISNICVLESSMMHSLGLNLGDTIRFNSPIARITLLREYFGSTVPGDGEESRRRDEFISQMLDLNSVFFTIVGEATSGSAHNTVYVPVTRRLFPVMSLQDVIIDLAEFRIAPRYAAEFRAFAASKTIGSVGDIGSPFVIDTEEADNMQGTLNLLDALYPIAVTAAAIMGGLFPGLIVMQSDREAAILRVLGTTKKRTRFMLVLEQTVLCATGILCAAALLLVINGIIVALYTKTISAYGMLHITSCSVGALTCAIIITKRRTLELLQVKE